jgi:anti-anti-sigma factor
MAKEFEIDAYRKGQELLIVLRGRLVLRYCQDVKTRLSSLFSSQLSRVYLYLAELSFLDSAGLGLLVGLKMQANRSNASLVFLSPPARVEDIFRVSKLHAIFEIQTGPEADVLYASIKKDEYCLWRDSRDAQQALFNTEQPTTSGGGGGSAAAHQLNITQLPSHATPTDELDARVHRHCSDAVDAIRQADYDKAVEAYRQALSLDPENLSALNNLGVVYEKKPEWYALSIETWRSLLDVSTRMRDDKHAERARKHIESLSKLMDAKP